MLFTKCTTIASLHLTPGTLLEKLPRRPQGKVPNNSVNYPSLAVDTLAVSAGCRGVFLGTLTVIFPCMQPLPSGSTVTSL